MVTAKRFVICYKSERTRGDRGKMNFDDYHSGIRGNVARAVTGDHSLRGFHSVVWVWGRRRG